MKRIYQMFVLPLFVIAMASCDTFADRVLSDFLNSGIKSIAQIIDILEDEGYVDLDANNTPSQHIYYEGKIFDDYGLDLDVVGFYQGYIPEYTRWTMIVVLASDTDSISFYDALNNDLSIAGYLWREGPAVIHTASLETYELFAGSDETSSETSSASSSSSLTSNPSETSSAAAERTVADMLAILYGAGYENIAGNNDEDTWQYRENQYLEDYGLTVEVTGFYQGYISGDTRWMKMEVFGSEDDAGEVFWALVSDSNVYNYLHIEGNVVLQTASEATWDLFN